MDFYFADNKLGQNGTYGQSNRSISEEKSKLCLRDMVFAGKEGDDRSRSSYKATNKDVGEGMKNKVTEMKVSLESLNHIINLLFS